MERRRVEQERRGDAELGLVVENKNKVNKKDGADTKDKAEFRCRGKKIQEDIHKARKRKADISAKGKWNLK